MVKLRKRILQAKLPSYFHEDFFSEALWSVLVENNNSIDLFFTFYPEMLVIPPD